MTKWTHENSRDTHHWNTWTYTKDGREIGTVTEYWEYISADDPARSRTVFSYHVQAEGESLYEYDRSKAMMIIEQIADPYAHIA